MKKILLTFLALTAFMTSAFTFPFLNKKEKPVELMTMPMFTTQSNAQNRVWVGTFQLCWNELMEEVVRGPVTFTNGKSYLAEQLNKKEFNKNMLAPNSYHTAHGVMNLKLKTQIETALKQKFDEKSDILNGMDWSGKNYLVYAMLKKDFEFISAYNELQKGTFGSSAKKVKYFGIDKKSPKELRKNVKVLFYNNDNDYAVELKTKQNDKVILYKTKANTPFSVLYDEISKKSSAYKGSMEFGKDDNLKVPFISFESKNTYPDLEKKTIKGTNFTIDKALQTIEFKMNNKGVKLKSEAALIMTMSMPMPSVRKPVDFYFDDTFVMFLMEKGKPYFALRVNDVAALNKSK